MKKPIEEYVRSIPDFPEKGIIFRDVTSILEDADGLQLAIDLMQEKIGDTEFDVVVGPESRGFIFGMPIAYNLQKAFVPIRKKGKLPPQRSCVPLDKRAQFIKGECSLPVLSLLLSDYRFSRIRRF